MRLPAASALASFLAGPTVQLPRAVVCIGNDAGDIDSLASALGLAVVLQQREPGVLYVPCAPFARYATKGSIPRLADSRQNPRLANDPRQTPRLADPRQVCYSHV